MAEVISINPTNFELQIYEENDTNLINKFDITTFFTGSSYIEFYIYDISNNTILNSNLNYTNYFLPTTPSQPEQFDISPEDDVTNEGYSNGEYIAYYNFLTKRIGDQFSNLFISEISSDRTEIRLDSTILSNLDILDQTNNFISFRDDQDYFVDFYLNFGDNILVIANNIKLENETTNDPTVLIKLYEPLPPSINIKDELWIVTTLNEPEAFQVIYPNLPITFKDSTLLQGPNYNIPIKGQINNSSQNLSYSDIINGAPTSSMNQVNSLLEESSIDISVDYTNFSDFIHFSSAQTRLENFDYKVGLIESYTSQSNTLTNVTSSTTSVTILQSKISDIIKNFDKFEYFMYYDSGSSASWPKSNTEPPYVLYPTTSSQALTWLGSADEGNSNYGGRILSASYFDNANPDQLKKAIPEYLREDPNNLQYDLFVDMVAQYYDNVWLYTKDVTQKYNADNRLDFGVSKELVSDAIKDFGVKLYQNNFSNQELYTAFLGLTPSGSLFPFPNITGSLPTPTGFEYVDTLISASNDIIPMDDVNKSLYKRIYHNIPYLLKSKGTIAGLRALITSYGIPDTILKISEFGGKDQVNENDWDYYFNKFNYNFNTEGTNSLSTTWRLASDWNSPSNRPATVEFRFKAEDILPTNLSQSLFSLYQSTTLKSDLVLEYTGSGLTSGPYSGSIKDPYYQYANLKWIPDVSAGSSASVYLPFFDEGWWSVMITSGSSNGYELTAANKIYNGNDGTSIGFISSASIATGSWNSSTNAYFATSSTHQAFSGSLQEIRYYNTRISESVFKDYVMNPLSTEGNNINSSPNQLAFRAGLGSELITSSSLTGSSIHPKITGSWVITQSFFNNNEYYFNSTPTYSTNTETIFLDQFPAGIKNRITDKIRYEDNSVPAGDTLSPFRRVTQNVEASASYTDSINYLEVAFSPQNQINDDIISQIGYFNIGDYIGDPRQRSSSAQIYPDLNNLSEDYFKKYIKQYDLVDFIRLIKFFDNSLFKMIKDFIPVRTSLASGLVVKQHLLERNKYPQPQVSYEDKIYTGSIDMVAISGGAGGVFNKFNSLTTSPSGSLGAGPNNEYNITQSWSETFKTLSGSVSKTNDSQYEFYNGEFSGSTLIISNGELNEECDWVKNVDPQGATYKIRSYNSIDDDFSNFITPSNHPFDGYIQVWFQDDSASPLPPPSPSS